MKEQVLERFLRYVKEYTESDPTSETFPSTEQQLVFADKLVKELQTLGFSDVEKDKYGYVMATVPATCNAACPTVGFIAHMDTSPDYSGENVNPIIRKYEGGDIQLNDELVLSPKQFPELLHYVGEEIITTDGNTLLGADDKAGIAEIITAMAHLLAHPEIEHGKIRVAFTPDEEIGKGADHFDVAKFGADFAYTLDGGMIGELEYENFNAAAAIVKVKGRSVHPGAAKDKMINAIQIAKQFDDMLPAQQRPEHTTWYDGFFHLMAFDGKVTETKLTYIIRDHCRELYEQKKTLIQQACDFINAKYGEEIVSVEISDQYFNMREMVEPVKYIVDMVEEAMKENDIVPILRPIRGGTDGARLSFMGLPCPNIFAGGLNFHGPYEFVPVRALEKATQLVVSVAQKVVSCKH
ncbi:MAG: peptidase T [Mangrovibacterium sp.]